MTTMAKLEGLEALILDAGARFVNIAEPEKKVTLNSALTKRLTGNDTITARYLNENSIEFKPSFKIFINTNHLYDYLLEQNANK